MKKLNMQIKKLNKIEYENYKLFNYILYQQNKINRRNNNNRFFNEELNKQKPIIIEHFINKEYDYDYNFIFLNNINNKSFHSKKYFNLDFKIKDKTYMNNTSKNSFSSKNSKNNLSSLLSDIYYKRNYNKILDGIWIKESNNDSSNLLFFNKSINEIAKRKDLDNKNNLDLALVPKRMINQLTINKKYMNEYDKKEAKYKLAKGSLRGNKYKKKKIIFDNKMRCNSCLFHNKKLLKASNDMDQRNRFSKLKSDLTDEKNKIKKMFKEFFKDPIFNKFNKLDRIEDVKLKNSLKRPRSSLSL